jgi:hypothetical protein
MTIFKNILAYIFYFMGDLVSKLLIWDLFSFLYPVYNKLMSWSSDLDVHGKIWRKPDEHEDYTNRMT